MSGDFQILNLSDQYLYFSFIVSVAAEMTESGDCFFGYIIRGGLYFYYQMGVKFKLLRCRTGV